MLLLRAFAVLCVFSALGGCAFGQKIDYRQSSPYLAVRSDKPIELSVVDERPYVSRSGKNSTFVGRIRGLYYNPFNVNTLSGSPLSADIQEAVRSALAKSGVNTVVSYAATSANPGQKLLVLKLREWKMDAYMKVRFDYDITASVLDEHGKELASKTAKNSGQVTNVIAAGTDALGEVLNSNEVVNALSSKPIETLPAPATVAEPAASAYDQCMRRIAKISDSALRTSSMSMCDDI
ncbi:hypothetical protein G7009_01555 [Pseudomonas capeferrum]|uniref:hypothetical protein n=1 Tax=Pseudomonas capeferrum TaxID=1495066 RepID=UPI0015E2DC09|nr:hypothetical protein [Pseudomonas capeferrum]MBA1200489.1 hypothetical protein [Pseudomonas capeferrum]